MTKDFDLGTPMLRIWRRIRFVLIFALVFIFMAPTIQANTLSQGCFAEHFSSAISVYQERKPLYSRASGGRSDEIYSTLLWNQRLARPVASLLDWMAVPYQERGIPILCLDFVDMKGAPVFIENESESLPKVEEFYSPDLAQVKTEFYQALDDDNFLKVFELAEREFLNLKTQPKLNCLYRHFVESIGRMAYLAPSYIQKSQEAKMEPPRKLMRWTMKMHVLFFEKAFALDRTAMSLQIQGIPILCRDVPPIEMKPSR